MTRAGRELEVQLLLDDLRPAVVALSEAEIPEEDSVVFNNYKVFYPLATEGKGLYRLLLLIREDYVSKYNPTVIRNSTTDIWVKMEMPCGRIAISSIYRQWTGSEEEEDLHRIHDTIKAVTNEYDRLLIIGDMNLDVARIGDNSYYRRKLLDLHLGCLEECGLELANELDMSPTFVSHGTFENKDGSTSQKSSTLDHVYYRGLPPPPTSLFSLSPSLTTGPPSAGSTCNIRARDYKQSAAAITSPSTPPSSAAPSTPLPSQGCSSSTTLRRSMPSSSTRSLLLWISSHHKRRSERRREGSPSTCPPRPAPSSGRGTAPPPWAITPCTTA